MTNRIFYFFLALFSFSQIHAQVPINDECSTAFDLGTAPFGTCTTTEYTNINATLSTVFSDPADNIPACWTSVENDVWFKFTTPIDGSYEDFEVFINSTGSNPIGQFKAALYRGECLIDELAELDCKVAAIGETQIKFNSQGLTPGLDYFIRVDDQSSTASPVWGTFNVCVDSLPDVEIMCDATGSTESSGLLYDTGGPDGDYQNNEDCTFTICPTDPAGCILLTVNNYNTELSQGFFGGGDELNIYDGPNTFSNQIGDDLSGGGSCYTVLASSGCVTVEWTSDNNDTNPGFEISWETTADACPTIVSPNLTTSPTEALIIEKLKSLPTAVSNITVNCDNDAHGTFDGVDNSFLGMDDGVVLTTGSANYAFTINDGPGDPTTTNNNNIDADLVALSNQLSGGFQPDMQDACVLEMDVLAASSTIAMEYVFGSDEYLTNINNNPTRSDVVGIWISGAGIAGDPIYNGQELISTIPNTNTPVHLSNINNQVNFEYFRYNYLTELGPRYDGLTTDYFSQDKKTLTASAQVEQCSTYHIKVAIADVDNNDNGTGDSGIFLSDLNVGLPNASLVGTTSFETLVEGCTSNDVVNLDLSNPLGEDLTLEVQITGTATSGADYTLNMPSTVTFTAGQTNLNFPITVVNDGIMEGTETIEIKLVYDFGCGEFDFAVINLTIEDAPNFSAENNAASVFVCAGESIQLNASGAVTYSWSPAANFNDPNIANPILTPAASGTYTVTGTLGSCVLTDDIFVDVVSPMVNITANGSTNICEGENVVLTANNNVNDSGISWSPSIGLSDANTVSPTATPPQTITYTATVSIAGCSVSDQIAVNVDPFDFPTLTTTDTILCLGDTMALASTTPGSQTDYVWTPNTDIMNPTEPNALAFPQNNTVYTLTATSPNGFCSQTADVNIEVVPANLEITTGNYHELCLGETVDLTAVISTGGAGFTWSPDSTLTSGTATTVTASPTFTTNYVAQLIVGGCTLTEVVTVQVDSLPDTSIDAIPQKDTYCKGEVVSFTSPSIDLGFFPNIQFDWTPADGSLISDPDNFNLAITAEQTQTYTRTVTNGGCSTTESITIEVIEVDVDLNVTDVDVCQGENIDLVASGADSYTWVAPEWMLTCYDCPNPTLSALINTPIQVIGESMGCFAEETFNVMVSESPSDCEAFSNVTNVPVGETAQVFSTYTSSSPVTVEWALQNGGAVGQGDSVMVDILLAGANTFEVTITNNEGCSCTQQVTIIGVKPEIEMADVFTPNGDGVNDFFNVLFKSEGSNIIVENDAVEILNFNIYNRWGDAVYENETPTTGWDGTIGGKAAASDVYIYVIEIKYPDGSTEIADGDLTLIR